MKLFHIIITLSVIFFASCSTSSEKLIENQKLEDSIKKAEAEALQQEAINAEKMLDSTDAVNKDTSSTHSM
jgi:hypothetical protein